MVPRPSIFSLPTRPLKIPVPIWWGMEPAAAPEPQAPARSDGEHRPGKQDKRSGATRTVFIEGIHRTLKEDFTSQWPSAASWHGISSKPAAVDRYLYVKVLSSSRSGEAPDGSAGLTEQVSRWRVAEGASARKVQRRWTMWYRRLYGASM